MREGESKFRKWELNMGYNIAVVQLGDIELKIETYIQKLAINTRLYTEMTLNEKEK